MAVSPLTDPKFGNPLATSIPNQSLRPVYGDRTWTIHSVISKLRTTPHKPDVRIGPRYIDNLIDTHEDFFKDFTSTEVRNIIREDLRSFWDVVRLAGTKSAYSRAERKYGFWVVLEWIYRRWSPDQIEEWHQRLIAYLSDN